ncbi:MAG: diaminopimelate decarboxylase [Chloroflexi bacterium]|nr:diaminopimelate decarboxylase [Chloroflexota bacterium]MCY4246655.1 diaminopimelate decarboxylase [Chloroflexota bacterium]
MVLNSSFRYVGGALQVDDFALEAIASEVGTPVYVYSLRRVLGNYRRLRRAFAPLSAQLHYSVKANGNAAIVEALAKQGSGFDCVSGGEIRQALAAGGAARQIVFAGVGKTRAEIEYAVERGVGWLNVENALELEYIQAAAERTGAESVLVALRLNPEVTAKTHPKIATGHGGAKFGMTAAVIHALLAKRNAYPRINFAGIHIHIGSQLGDSQATIRAVEKALELARPYPQIRAINLGGGLPVAYQFAESPPPVDELVQALSSRLGEYRVLLEPGRAIVADAGALLAEVLYVKRQAGQVFYIVDAGMTDLLRPALYDAHHEVLPLRKASSRGEVAQLVGPVCESTDVLARDRLLPPLQVGDKIALMTAGAYGMAMASNYNARPLPAEVLVDAAGAGWRASRSRNLLPEK